MSFTLNYENNNRSNEKDRYYIAFKHQEPSGLQEIQPLSTPLTTNPKNVVSDESAERHCSSWRVWMNTPNLRKRPTALSAFGQTKLSRWYRIATCGSWKCHSIDKIVPMAISGNPCWRGYKLAWKIAFYRNPLLYLLTHICKHPKWHKNVLVTLKESTDISN